MAWEWCGKVSEGHGIDRRGTACIHGRGMALHERGMG